ncbi:DJ-1 family glyoxalase III [Spirochaeta lutea]|uniref:DJ-1 family glyoxalase III n=1 Tax=Spirochaeta lutea TaxID=1480694 RepID=UPI00068C77A5|nr:DJ-1 family glyoxalase III [Spirochaeta lutea]
MDTQQKGVCILVAPGFEEVETVTPMDFLRRAGVRVRLAGIGDTSITGSRQLTVVTDCLVQDYQGIPDAVVLPGGMPGAANIYESPQGRDLVKRVLQAGGIVAAICAAPAVALGGWGLLEGVRFTCYPGHEEAVSQGTWVQDRVVWDKPFLTSRGPGTAAEFSLALISLLSGKKAAESVARATLQPESTLTWLEGFSTK